MASLNQKYELTLNQELIKRVKTVAIGQALAVLADATKANQHDYFKDVLKNRNGGRWLEDLMWEVVQNPDIQLKMVDAPNMHTPFSIDQDIEYILTNPDTGVIQKYSVAPEPTTTPTV